MQIDSDEVFCSDGTALSSANLCKDTASLSWSLAVLWLMMSLPLRLMTPLPLSAVLGDSAHFFAA